MLCVGVCVVSVGVNCNVKKHFVVVDGVESFLLNFKI